MALVYTYMKAKTLVKGTKTIVGDDIQRCMAISQCIFLHIFCDWKSFEFIPCIWSEQPFWIFCDGISFVMTFEIILRKCSWWKILPGFLRVIIPWKQRLSIFLELAEWTNMMSPWAIFPQNFPPPKFQRNSWHSNVEWTNRANPLVRGA